MRSTKKKRMRCGLGAAGLGVLVALAVAGCEPDIGNDPTPSFMIFDTETGQIPEPTIAAVSQTTGLLDFGPLGIVVPDGPGACVGDAVWGTMVAECEFFQYLETLDGYPTLSTMRCPASAPLDESTITYDGAAEDTLVVLENGMRKVTAADGLLVAFNTNDNYLYIDNPAGWEVGATYIGGVRGYDNGVTTTDGTRVVAPVVYSLLKREESLLDCAPDADTPPFYDPAATVDETCKYYVLFEELYGEQFPDPAALHAFIVGTLGSLEALRQGYKGNDGMTGMWDLLGGPAGLMDKADAAMAWAWPVHSQTTIELQPLLGMVPVPSGDRAFRLAFKGSIDASSLVPFDLGNGDVATVYLLNATVLQEYIATGQGSLLDAVPAFTPTVDGDELLLTADNALVAGDRYIIMLVSKAEGDNRPADFCGVCDGPVGQAGSRPLVPSPLVVYLRTRGPLTDGNGASIVSKLDDASAAELEANRVALAELFDDPLFATLTVDLIRENVSYVFAFDYAAP